MPYIYFIQDRRYRWVKIGYTGGVLNKRLLAHANAYPLDLTFLGWMHGNETVEHQWHKTLAKWAVIPGGGIREIFHGNQNVIGLITRCLPRLGTYNPVDLREYLNLLQPGVDELDKAVEIQEEALARLQETLEQRQRDLEYYERQIDIRQNEITRLDRDIEKLREEHKVEIPRLDRDIEKLQEERRLKKDYIKAHNNKRCKHCRICGVVSDDVLCGMCQRIKEQERLIGLCRREDLFRWQAKKLFEGHEKRYQKVEKQFLGWKQWYAEIENAFTPC